MTISPNERELPQKRRRSDDSSGPFDDLPPSDDDRSTNGGPNESAAFSKSEHSWIAGLFASWGITMRVVTLVVAVLAMGILALWLLPIEVAIGPVVVRR
jgi:hypothetical protein